MMWQILIIMSDSKKINQKPVSPPDDLNKPFFAYGVFKKGQLAHSKIEDYVESVDDDAEIENCMMMIRDGIPLISNEKAEGYTTKGHIIWFLDEYRAYKIISDTEPEDLYEWGKTTVKGVEVNVLYGKNPQDGSYPYENDNGIYVDNFEGTLDPLFSDDLFDLLEYESNNLKDDDCDIFRLQMCYMMLWSAIDRYCILKYDSINYQSDNLKKLSEDPVFRESVDESDLPSHNQIYSAKDAKEWEWREWSYFSKLYFYYVVRCNVVHRGKDRQTNIGILHESLDELLCVFRKVIDKTFP